MKEKIFKGKRGKSSRREQALKQAKDSLGSALSVLFQSEKLMKIRIRINYIKIHNM